MVQSALLRSLDLKSAVVTELNARTRLLPQTNADLELAGHADQVEQHLRGAIQHSSVSAPASVLFASKPRGSRPLNVWRLQDRVLYRALTEHLRAQLPTGLRDRPKHEEFERAPLADSKNSYITATDVASYYVYVDHDLLGDELIAQTGDFETVTATLTILNQVMGGKVGLPQVHDASDLLGDTYIDPVRRQLIRAGFSTHTFSDDFRISAPSLGAAREALELCASSARRIGLVLNDGKTFTYGRSSYEASLDKFSIVEEKIVAENDLSAVAKFLFRNPYAENDGDTTEADAVIESFLADNEAPQATVPNAQQFRTIWTLWADDVNNGQKSPTIRQLLDQALPKLGTLGDQRPLEGLDELLRLAPELTPKTAIYLREISDHQPDLRPLVIDRIITALNSEVCSRWQKVWLLHAAGEVGSTTSPFVATLAAVVERADPILSAFAAEALARLQTGPAQIIAKAIEFVAPELRGSMAWALGQLDSTLARSVADTEIDRLLVSASK